MVDQAVTEEEVNNVVFVKFALADSPIDVQLTVHINNLLNTYGDKMIKEFKEKLNNPERYCGHQINGLIGHYGVDVIKNWFSLIYGWEFKKVG